MGQNRRNIIKIPNYDPHRMKHEIRAIANHLYPGYEFTPAIQMAWRIVAPYFAGDPEVEKMDVNGEQISLNKSLVLYGHYGCGKTAIFHIIHKWLELCTAGERSNSFRFTSTEDILHDMADKSWLDLPNQNNINLVDGIEFRRPLHICINEFGYQYDAKIYGTRADELIDQFMMKRYDLYQADHKLTHATMNLDADGIKAVFSERLVDRFREMFNIIPIMGKSFRK
jgi:DNA replication protein DnaC